MKPIPPPVYDVLLARRIAQLERDVSEHYENVLALTEQLKRLTLKVDAKDTVESSDNS